MADPVVPDTGYEEDLEQAREIDSDNEILPGPTMEGGQRSQVDFNFPCLTALVESSELFC